MLVSKINEPADKKVNSVSMATKTSKSNNCFASIAEAESESESDNLNKSVDDIR